MPEVHQKFYNDKFGDYHLYQNTKNYKLCIFLVKSTTLLISGNLQYES